MVDDGSAESSHRPDTSSFRRSSHAADQAVMLFRPGAESNGRSAGHWAPLLPEGPTQRRVGPEVGFGRMLHAAGERDFAIVRVAPPTKGIDLVGHIARIISAARNALPGTVRSEVAAILVAATADGPGPAMEKLRAAVPAASGARILLAATSVRAGDGQPSVPTNGRPGARFSAHDLDLRKLGWQGLSPTASIELGRRFARAWLAQGGAPSLRANR